MPVKVFPTTNEARPIAKHTKEDGIALRDALDLTGKKQSKKILQASPNVKFLDSEYLKPSSNGLVWSILHAYNGHHHLLLRPDEIWLAVITQFQMFVNANAEELRGKFVALEGQKELEIVYSKDTIRTVEWSGFALEICKLIEQNVVDPELREWLMPNFSTTTSQDKVVASIVMMSCMQKYFKYTARTSCSLPSVTLEGTKKDYQKIVAKVRKLTSYGRESTKFAELLTPVISRMARTFDNPSDKSIKDFWSRILSVDSRSGETIYSGWMTAFCFWNEEGKCLYNKCGYGIALDKAHFHRLDGHDVPPGYSKVPVTVFEGGSKTECVMVAGAMGIGYSSSEGLVEDDELVLDTMQPQSAWLMYRR